MKSKLLIVEDDYGLGEMIRSFLIDQGFEVELIDNGLRAVEAIKQSAPDLVVLDVMLPGMNGVNICKTVRPNYSGPILMLTARDDEITEINALNRGANGYLTKPVRPHVLLAHVKAMLRKRTEDDSGGDSAFQSGLIINKESLQASLDGGVLDLTTAEFYLLEHLKEHAGTVLSRDSLYRDLRGIEYDGLDRSIDMRISTLREKLKDTKPPYRFIKTVRNRGYLFCADKS